MTLVLHPRAAPGDRLQVWLGALDRTAPPDLRWTLDGAPANPVAHREMQGARPEGLLAGNSPRAFTGVFELPGLQPGSMHEVGVSDGRTRSARPRPATARSSRSRPASRSPTTTPSDRCQPAPREGRGGREANLSWLGRQLASERFQRPVKDGAAPTLCLLLGGRGSYDFRLRVAQAQLRHDLTPSNWSQAAFMVEHRIGDDPSDASRPSRRGRRETV